MRLYLSGPMKGLPDSNYPTFAEARERLRGAGYDVYCPAEGNDPTIGLEAVKSLMKGHVRQVVECDAIVLLPGYGQSEGAKVELAVAVSIGLPVYLYHKHRPDPLTPLLKMRVLTRCEAI